EQGGDQEVKEVADVTGAVEFLQIELREEARREELVRHVWNTYGKIDGLVNNAGVNDSVSLREGSVADFLESYQKNVVHVFSLVQKTLPALIASKGNVVNIGRSEEHTSELQSRE